MENIKEHIKNLYISLYNTKNLLYDGKYIQADRNLQSNLTKLNSLLLILENEELANKNNGETGLKI